MNKVILIIVLFIVGAIYGPILEWSVGQVWDVFGECPYEYADSPLTYTSFIMMPLWGIAGLQAVVLYRAIRYKRPSLLLWLLLLIVLTFALIALLSRI